MEDKIKELENRVEELETELKDTKERLEEAGGLSVKYYEALNDIDNIVNNAIK